MKIMFLVPPRLRKKELFLSTQHPIGLGFLMTYIRDLGHEVLFIDYEVEDYDSDSLIRRCKNFAPDVVGLTAMTPQIVQAHNLAKLLKSHNPALSTVIGGKHASILPQKTLRSFPAFDYLVVGEGEYTMQELLEVISKGTSPECVAGLAWRDGDAVRVNELRQLIYNLDDIPHPDRSLFQLDLYGKGMSFKGMWRTKRHTEIITARGCPNNCIFCASQIITKRRMRYRSVPHLLVELEECRTKYGFKHYRIVDDTFTINKKRVLSLCEWFARHKVTFNCNARVNTVDRRMLQVMKDSGCIGIMYGVESGSQKILNMMKKGAIVEQAIDAFRWSHEAGIPVIEADFILGGHPDENMGDINKTRELIKILKPHYLSIGTMVPYPTAILILTETDFGLSFAYHRLAKITT